MHAPRLKICDLCGAPNLMENQECHVCGWRGHFRTDPASVRAALEAARRMQRWSASPPVSLRFAWRQRLVEAWSHLQDWYRRRRRSWRFP